jgi:hypothetical protein
MLSDTIRAFIRSLIGDKGCKEPARIISRSEDFQIRSQLQIRRSHQLILADQDPKIRKVKFCFGGFHSDYVLSFPRMLFGLLLSNCAYSNLYAFFLKDNYRGPHTPLYLPHLPNIWNTGQVCVGSETTKHKLAHLTRSAETTHTVKVVLSHFWDSEFDQDLADRMLTTGPQVHPCMISLADWERASRTNPDFVRNANYVPSGTVSEFISRLR